jgi:hypothetical protein
LETTSFRLRRKKYFLELFESFKKTDEMWENTRNAIQNSISGFMGDSLKGEFEDFKEYFKGFANSLTDIWTTHFVEQMMKSNSFSDFMLSIDKMSNFQAGLGLAQAGMQAAKSNNPFQIGGTALGAGIGSFGGLPGAALGASLGGMFGGMFGDKGPSEASLMMEELRKNTEAIKSNTEELKRKIMESYPGEALRGDITADFFDSVDTSIDKAKGKLGSKALEAITSPYNDIGSMAEYARPGNRDAAILDYAIFKAGEKWGPYWAKEGFKAEKQLNDFFDSIYAAAENALTKLLENAVEIGEQIDSSINGMLSQIGKGPSAYQSAMDEYKDNLLSMITPNEKGITAIASKINDLNILLKETGKDTEFGQKILEQIENLKDYKKEIIALGPEIKAFFQGLKGDVFEDMQGYIDELKGSISTFTTVMDKVNDDFADFIDSLKDAGATVNELTRAENRRTQALQQAASQYRKEARMAALPLMKELGTISPAQFYKTMLNTLMKDYQKASSDDWTQQISLLSQMNSLLSEIQGTLEQQLSAQIAAMRSIDKMILDLTGGNLAAVQSIEFFEVFYDTLLKKALGGAPDDVNEYLGFIKEYADFAKLYGGDYAAFTKSLVEDLYQVRDAVAQGASLADLESQLKIIADNTVDISKLPVSFDDLKTEITKVYDAITSTSIADMIEPYLNVGEVIVTDATIPTATIENAVFNGNLLIDASQVRPEVWASFMAYSGGAFAEGGKTSGISIAGEAGPEWVIPTYEPERTSFLRDIGISPEAIATSIAKILGPAAQGGDIHVPVIIDGREIAYVVAKQIKYGHSDLIDNIRMVH